MTLKEINSTAQENSLPKGSIINVRETGEEMAENSFHSRISVVLDMMSLRVSGSCIIRSVRRRIGVRKAVENIIGMC